MENAADALKIAFAIFVLVIAITITFSLISQAKSTADVVLYHSDETNFYENLDSNSDNRRVSVSEIIPNLYRYYEESVAVTIKLLNGSTYTFDLGNNEYIHNEPGETKLQLGSKKEREQNLAKFINKILLDNSLVNAQFEEEFVEVPISGIYETGDDQTEIVLSSGGKKVYITYIQQQ